MLDEDAFDKLKSHQTKLDSGYQPDINKMLLNVPNYGTHTGLV